MAWGSETPVPPPVQWGAPSPTLTQDELIVEWGKKAIALEKAKAEEIRLRNEVLARMFPGAEAGTHNFDLGRGYTLKGEFKDNYSLDKDTAKVEKALDEMEALGEAGKLLAERVVNWKPELKVSEYKALPPTLKAIIEPLVTIKPGQAALTLVPPKDKK